MDELDMLFEGHRYCTTVSYPQFATVVERVMERGTDIKNMKFTQGICELVAQEYETNGKAVYKSVRTQLDKCWDSSRLREEVCMVCYGRIDRVDRPSPKMFACLLAEYVRRVRNKKTVQN